MVRARRSPEGKEKRLGIKLRDDFLWGVATSGHQIEGGNWNSDWWEFEHTPGAPIEEASGDACDSYHRYGEDVRLVADLGLNAYRFGVEWPRVEPEDGEFSVAAIDHYRRVIEACREHNIEPLITFNHATLPRWASHRGGWLWPDIADRFARYSDRLSRALNDDLRWVMTINQPDLTANLGYRYGQFPAGYEALKSSDGDTLAERCTPILIDAHRRARDAIRASAPRALVGVGLAAVEWSGFDGPEEELEQLPAVREWDGPFHGETDGDDYVGVQVYTRMLAVPYDGSPIVSPGATGYPHPPGTRLALYGYPYRPEALGAAVRRTARKTGLPVLVTENGLGTNDDAERCEFITAALRSLGETISDGIDIRGYFHWSLIDNFEWNLGYRLQFGIVGVDRRTFARTPKPSAHLMGEFARRNELP
jgi:beta-glucosidase